VSALPRGLSIRRIAPAETGYRDASARPTLEVSRTWRSMWGIAPGLFRIAWGAFVGLSGLSIAALIAIGVHSPRVRMIGGIFEIAVVVLGIAATYAGLCMLINRTRLSVSGDDYVVGHGPLPWPGRRWLRSPERPRIEAALASALDRSVGTVDLRGGSTQDPRWDVRVVFPDGVALIVFRQTDGADAERVAGAISDAVRAFRP